jgi:hypothetical protein
MTSGKEQSFAAEFQRRRQAYLRLLALSWLLAAGAVVLKLAVPSIPLWVFGVLICVGIVGHFRSDRIAKYACPRCEARPDVGEGWFPQPTRCRVCNLNFKP